MASLRNILNRTEKYTKTSIDKVDNLFFVKTKGKFTNRILSVTFEETYSMFSKKTCKKEEFEDINEFIEIQSDTDFLLIVSSLVYKEFNPKKYVGSLFSDIKKKFTIEVNVEGKEPIKFRLDEREKMMAFFRQLKDI